MKTVEHELDRHLNLLRSLMRQRGMSQLEVQEALGWGRSYISQLFTKQKTLRFDQVLKILDIIGVSPAEYFGEIYPLPRRGVDPVHQIDSRQVPASLQDDMQRLTTLIRGLIRLLTNKGLFTAGDLAQAVEEAENEHQGQH